jgi:MFS family permease
VNRILIVALVAMFLQQTFATLAKNVIPIVAPAALPDLGLSAAYVGYYISFSAFVQIFIMLSCGNYIRRFGGLRISQVGLVCVGIGLTCAASGLLWPFLITAIALTLGTASATPASSQILARVTPSKQAPMVFSAKQTAVPFGIMIGGLVLPFFVLQFGWQGAMLAIAALCTGFAIILEPTRNELDQDRDPDASLSPQGIKFVLITIIRSPDLRALAISMFAFVGLQISYTTFLILFLTERLGYSLTEAGGIFAMATLIGLPARMLWGYVASVWSTPWRILSGLGFTMSAASIATGFFSPEWHYAQILAVSVVVTSTALGWHGVMLSEVARLAPPGHAGGMTGGVLAFSALGQIIIPLSFSAILTLTDSYTYGFIMAGIPPAIIGVMLLVQQPVSKK